MCNCRIIHVWFSIILNKITSFCCYLLLGCLHFGNLAPKPSCNQKRRAFRSSENQIKSLFSYDPVAYSLAENTVKVTSKNYSPK